MQFVELKITYEDIVLAIKKALTHKFIDNLRNRNEFVQFDSKIRGYLGEICLARRFEEQGIRFDSIDYKDDDSFSLDIDFLFKGKILELKTSLIPDVYKNLSGVLEKADIKIIKRSPQETIEMTHGDIHMQIYFNHLRKVRDSFYSKIKGKISDYDEEELIKIMDLESYRQVFLRWIDKESLCNYINGLIDEGIDPTRKYGYREFRKCPLKNVAKTVDKIIPYLNNL